MQIKKSKLIQIIREEMLATVLGQWTTLGLKAALLRNATPRKPDNISDEVWNTSIERCVTGESEYCPLNYGVEEYVRSEPRKREKTDLTKLLKPASHYKKKKRKPAKPLESESSKARKLFPGTEDGCEVCEMWKAFSGDTSAKSASQVASGMRDFRKYVSRKLTMKGHPEGDYTDPSGRMISREFYLDIIKDNRVDLPVGRYHKKLINRMHNLWQGMNSEQRSWILKQIRD